MYPYSSERAAHQVRRLLRTASRVLGTVDPSGPVSGLLDDALPLPAGDPAYRSRHAFEPRFSETSSGALTFSVQVPERSRSGSGGVRAASRNVRELVGANFGRSAARWFDRSTDGLGDDPADDEVATVVSAFDRDGFREAQLAYEWGPATTQALPDAAIRVTETVLALLPGAAPAFTTVRAARQSGSRSITFRLDRDLPLAALEPVMQQLGLGDRHRSLMTAVAFVLGARYTLPAGCGLLSFRPTRFGIELRVDVDLEMVPDLPPNVADLIALQLSERPRSLRSLEHWVAAFSTESDASPGSLSVMSVTVRPDMGARLALYIRPLAVSASPSPPPPFENVSAPVHADPAAAESIALVPAGQSFAGAGWR